MTPTHATSLRHLAIPGIAFPQSILVGGNVLIECDWRGRSSLSGAATGRLADLLRTVPRQLFEQIARLCVRS